MNKVNRVLFMAVILTLVLGGSAIQAQDEVDLSQPGGLIVFYADGSRVMCATEVLDNGWSGGMFVPPADSPSPSVYASCNVPYSLSGVTRITFNTVEQPEVVFDLECADGFVPDSPEMFCRVRPS